jgi:hypothetical protein
MNWALVRSTPKTEHRGVRAERQQWGQYRFHRGSNPLSVKACLTAGDLR